MAAPNTQPTPRRERGQSLVEFSLMLIFLVTTLLGVLDLGRAYYTYLQLKDAGAEGAYFGSAFPKCISNSSAPGCASPNNIDYRVRNSAPGGGMVDWTSVTISVNAPATPKAGDTLTVTVTYNYQLITPVVGAIVGGQSLLLTARTAQTIIAVPDCSENPCK